MAVNNKWKRFNRPTFHFIYIFEITVRSRPSICRTSRLYPNCTDYLKIFPGLPPGSYPRLLPFHLGAPPRGWDSFSHPNWRILTDNRWSQLAPLPLHPARSRWSSRRFVVVALCSQPSSSSLLTPGKLSSQVCGRTPSWTRLLSAPHLCIWNCNSFSFMTMIIHDHQLDLLRPTELSTALVFLEQLLLVYLKLPDSWTSTSLLHLPMQELSRQNYNYDSYNKNNLTN